jgi:pimeloyl-ACP methyl ester carboxylesterase
VKGGVRKIALPAGGVTLSALLAEPADAPPRAVVVALHGAGLAARYFHGPADPAQSLLTLGASLGYTVLAVDRPGYGRSAAALPKGQRLVGQAATLRAALDSFAARHPVGDGVFLLGHSFGGKLALTLAAEDPGLLGLDVSGLGHYYAVDPAEVPHRNAWTLHWGPLGLYPPGTFRLAAPLISAVPALEGEEVADWPDRFPGLAGRVRIPVRLTFAEHERWWRHDAASLAELTALLAAPRVVVDRLPHAGHNVSLGVAARAYHLRALAFFDECLTGRRLRRPALSQNQRRRNDG